MRDDAPAEATVRAVALGFATGLVLTGAITYLALYSGLAVSAAIPAALTCTGLLQLVRRRATLQENNLAQTIASSGEALAVGVAFTVPALVLAGAAQQLEYWQVTIAAGLGGVLGVLCVIPLRRSLTHDAPELRFPESEAAAQVSAAGGEGRRGLRPALLAVLGGAAFKGLSSFAGLTSGTVQGAVRLGGRVFSLGTDVSIALVGVGLIVELPFTALLLLGGVISWLVAIPLTTSAGNVPQGALVALANRAWSDDIRYIGIGAMIVGACWSIVQARLSISRGVRATVRGLRRHDRTDADIPQRWVITMIGLTAVASALFLSWTVGSTVLGVAATVVIVVLVFAFAAVSGYIVGMVGNSNNPISGLALSAFFLVALLVVVTRVDLTSRLLLCVLLICVFVCTAAATAGDTAQHLATGAMVGATPRRQQVAQLAGVIVFAFVVSPFVVLLQHGYGVGTGRPGALEAPQAVVLANLADAVFGAGHLPSRQLWIGVAAGVLLVAGDAVTQRIGRRFRLRVMPVAIGMYLPLTLSVPLVMGGLLGWLLRRMTRNQPVRKRTAVRDRSVLLSAGLITGESLVGLSVAVPKAAGWPLPVSHLNSAPLSLAMFGLCLAAVLWFSRCANASSE